MLFVRTSGLAIAFLVWLPEPASAQSITFEDLQGATINATIVYAQTFRRLDDGRVISNTNTQTIRLKIGPGEDIDQLHSVSITAPDGRHIGSNSFPGKFTLNKPRKGRFGEIIWLFDEGKLVRLQTFSPAAGASP